MKTLLEIHQENGARFPFKVTHTVRGGRRLYIIKGWVTPNYMSAYRMRANGTASYCYCVFSASLRAFDAVADIDTGIGAAAASTGVACECGHDKHQLGFSPWCPAYKRHTEGG
jgi:hypothetical protein